MTTPAPPPAAAVAAAFSTHPARSEARSLLDGAARLWFLVAVAGQWIFAVYVTAFYGGAALRGDLAAWNKVLPHGYVAGDTVGNLSLAVHLALAVIVIVGGPLQLVPQIRAKAPAFHRWTGRIYLPSVFLTSLVGLYFLWTRGTVGDTTQHVGISGLAVLIMAFAILALRSALARDFRSHRRWALRLFLVSNGVWFFRVGLMFWLLVNQRPVGFDPKSFTGPFLSFLSFADYLLPLAVLELYFQAQDRGGAVARRAMAAVLVLLTLAMAAGIFAATMGMWMPRISG